MKRHRKQGVCSEGRICCRGALVWECRLQDRLIFIMTYSKHLVNEMLDLKGVCVTALDLKSQDADCSYKVNFSRLNST